MNGAHHPKADVERLYISRKSGGRGLIELESAHATAIVGLNEYIQLGKDKLTTMVRTHEAGKTKYSLSKMAKEIKQRFLLTEHPNTSLKKSLKDRIHKDKKEKLKQKPLHGQLFRMLDRPFVDKEASMQWLSSAGLKAETESLILAAQDQALNTRYHQKKFLKMDVDSKCRLCQGAEEHVNHIIAGCPILAPVEYLHRHNKVASYLHWTILKDLGAEVTEHWYEHAPQKVTNVQDTVIMWDMAIYTDRTMAANRPDIVVHNRRKKTCLLIDVAIPDDANILTKEAEKINKYRDLEIEVKRMWNTKTKIVPVIIGALGTLKKGFNNNLEKLPGKPRPNEVQKITLLGTAHILRKFLL